MGCRHALIVRKGMPMSLALSSIARQILKGLLLGGAFTAIVGVAILYKTGPLPEHTPPEAKPPPRHVSGLARVVETNLLSVAGTTIPLAGLESVNRPEAVQAAQAYLDRAGAISCRPAAAQWTCRVTAKDFDLAEIFVLSGSSPPPEPMPPPPCATRKPSPARRAGVFGA